MLVVRLASDVLAPVFHGELGRILKVKVLEEPKSEFTSRIGQAKCFEAADEELKFFSLARGRLRRSVEVILGGSVISSLVRP